MELQLLGTLYDRRSRTIKDKSQADYVTIGMSRYFEGIPPKLTDYVTLGIKDGTVIATVEIGLDEFERMFDILLAAKTPYDKR